MSPTQSVAPLIASGAPDASRQAARSSFLPMVGVLLAVLFVQVVWFSYDLRVPSTDEAGHILNGLQYKDLLRHFYFWKPDWIVKFLSVNPFYPPGVYIYDGFLKLVLGNGRWVDNLCWLSYVAILTASTYGIAWKASNRWQVAAAAALLVNLYPQIALLSHVYMLDLPLAATVSAGLFALMWWQAKPTWKRTFMAGAVLLVACLTKQLGAAYLIPPCLYLLCVSRARIKLVAMGVMVASVMLPWLAVNIQWIKGYANENAANMQGAQLSPVVVFFDYGVGLAYSLSFALTIALVIASCFVSREHHRRMSLLYVTAVGGLALTSLLSCTFALDRYAAPVLVVCAVVTACGAVGLIERNRKLGVAFVAVVAFSASLQYTAYCFSPVPIAMPWLDQCGKVFHTELREFRGARIGKSLPVDMTAWGHDWVVETIALTDPQSPVWLNILPSMAMYNPHSFELLAREKGSPIKPTTSRYWTIMGDRVDFSPETALYYHWYLLKTGHQGNQLKDEDSQKNYDHLVAYIKTGGHFQVVAEKPIPDGSVLTLYRQK